MKIVGIDGRQYPWDVTGYQIPESDTISRSSLHLEARRLLKATFLAQPCLEEVYLPGSGGLHVDFFLPRTKLAVECQGEQHYKFVYHFHGTMAGYIDSKKRDTNKLRWCELNKIRLVEFPYNETVEQWQKRLTSNYKG